ncbi:helicostatins-like isoform X2 [Phymastichus coffea]|uniref:helicostatins-like isoform X2 n=1 Tax=Phymastichus coffea TaxID=108790 RepID=UPI00273CCED2|nr:helicostatins-like isoform X2 [Phymastichus coffea]
MKSTTTAHLILLCTLSILHGWTSAIEDSVSSHDGAYSDPREQSVGGKRAYEYRSEYKRLPLFQFGLGKRMAPSYEEKRAKPLSFGLGKRKPSCVFVLGKKSDYDEDGYSDELYDNSPFEAYVQDKRTESSFAFGLETYVPSCFYANWWMLLR